MLDVFNTVVSGILAALTAYGVMSPRLRLGLCMQLGLAIMSLGFLGSFLLGFQDVRMLHADAAVNTMINAGLTLCIFRYGYRARRRGPRRRASDWVRLED